VEPREYLRILRKSWALILAFIVAGSALGVGLTAATPKVYQANVQVFVATYTGATGAELANGNTFSQDRVQSYTSIANSPAVTGPVISKLNLRLSRAQLAAKISADAPPNKVLINLHVTDHNPQQSATLANAVATQFSTVVQKIEQTDASGKAVVKVTVIHPATVPSAPIKPSKLINIGLGFILGLLAGIGLVIARDALDNTVKGPQDFEPLGVPVLGYVPFDKRAPKTPIAFRSDPHSARSEAYRQLRTNLQFVNVDAAPRIIAVTSAVPGEGKTTTALNLAAALAEGGFRVCLVEADLRRPNLAQVLGLVGDVGFTTALIGKAQVDTVLQNAGRNLAVLTSGPVPPNPSELLISEHARKILHHIAETVDYTIIDTAPLLPVADGAEVAALADATLVVHHAGKSTREQAARSMEALAKVGEKPVGVVLNMITRGRGRYDDQYGYYYAPYRPERSGHGRHGPTKLAATPGSLTPEADSADVLVQARHQSFDDLRPAPDRRSLRSGAGIPAERKP
jgi:capsular exopolysaccharide synthesis family protein